jgi:hypothetical protein
LELDHARRAASTLGWVDADDYDVRHYFSAFTRPIVTQPNSRASCAKVYAVLRMERRSTPLNLEHLVCLQVIPPEGRMLWR